LGLAPAEAAMLVLHSFRTVNVRVTAMSNLQDRIENLSAAEKFELLDVL